jgi:hypothetical protein
MSVDVRRFLLSDTRRTLHPSLLLSPPPYSLPQLVRREVECRRVVQELTSALESGGATGTPEDINVSSIGFDGLTSALATAATLGLPTEQTRKLHSLAQVSVVMGGRWYVRATQCIASCVLLCLWGICDGQGSWGFAVGCWLGGGGGWGWVGVPAVPRPLPPHYHCMSRSDPGVTGSPFSRAVDYGSSPEARGCPRLASPGRLPVRLSGRAGSGQGSRWCVPHRVRMEEGPLAIILRGVVAVVSARALHVFYCVMTNDVCA